MDRPPGVAVILQKRLFDFLDFVLRRTAGGGADNLLLDHALLRPLLAAFVAVQTFAGKVAELHSPGTQPRMAWVPMARCRRSESGSVSVVGDTLARRIRSAKYHELATIHRVMRNGYSQRRSVVAESASKLIMAINLTPPAQRLRIAPSFFITHSVAHQYRDCYQWLRLITNWRISSRGRGRGPIKNSTRR